MSCEDQATLNIIQGEDKLGISIFIRDSKGKPFPLTGWTLVTVKFPGTLTAVSKDTTSGVTVINAVLGQITVDLSDTDTAAMSEGKLQNIEIIIDIGTVKSKANLYKALNVFKDAV